MNPGEFNRIFNRFATIDLTLEPMPSVLNELAIEVPREVFVPVRNVRQLVTGTADPRSCSQPTAGGIQKVSTEGSTLVVEGWAPSMAETNVQMIRVLSARPLRPVSISTTTRPDIAERIRDYRFVKAGFKLKVSSVDTRPVQTKDVVIMASCTVAPRLADRDVRLPCCGCP